MSFLQKWSAEQELPVPEGAALTEAVIASLPEDCAIREVWPAGHTVMTCDYPFGMFYIAEGTVEVSAIGADGHPAARLKTLTGGDFVGEMGFLQGIKRCATVTTKTDCIVYLIPDYAFAHLTEQLPCWAMVMFDNMIDRLRAMDNRLAEVTAIADAAPEVL